MGQSEQDNSLSCSSIDIEDLAPEADLKMSGEESEELGSPILGPRRWVELDPGMEELVGTKRRSISGCPGASACGRL